jgi:ribose transport system permease protein
MAAAGNNTGSTTTKRESDGAPTGLTLVQSFWRIWRRGGIVILLLVFALALTLLTNRFLTSQNLFNVARQVSVPAMIAFGLLVVMVTGNVDLTVGAFMGFAGALISKLSLQLGVLPALGFGLAVALVVGFTNGYLSTRGAGLSVIVTLAMMSILQGTTLLYTDSRPIVGLSPAIIEIGKGYVGPIPWPAVFALVTAIIIHFILRHTVYGRQLYAIGGNAEAARLSGIPVNARIISAFVISAVLSALAGLVLSARVASAQPTAGIGDELNAVGAVLIGGASLNGGAGSVIGTLSGVLVLGLISNGLNLLQVNPFYQYIIKGLIILFAILMDQWGRK